MLWQAAGSHSCCADKWGQGLCGEGLAAVGASLGTQGGQGLVCHHTLPFCCGLRAVGWAVGSGGGPQPLLARAPWLLQKSPSSCPPYPAPRLPSLGQEKPELTAALCKFDKRSSVCAVRLENRIQGQLEARGRGRSGCRGGVGPASLTLHLGRALVAGPTLVLVSMAAVCALLCLGYCSSVLSVGSPWWLLPHQKQHEVTCCRLGYLGGQLVLGPGLHPSLSSLSQCRSPTPKQGLTDHVQTGHRGHLV